MSEFKGYCWSELAHHWGIVVSQTPLSISVIGSDDGFLDLCSIPESIEKVIYINESKIVFEITNEDEVLAEKIKKHINSFLNAETGEFTDKTIRIDLENFLLALIRESKKYDYNYPVYEGILKIENDFTFAKWICNNLEMLWT